MKKVTTHDLTDLYLIGLDIIVDANKNVKILEIQDVYESDTNLAYKLVGIKPIEWLISQVRKDYPKATIEFPELNSGPLEDVMDEYTRKTSSYKGKTVMINRGIKPMCDMKWLFYSFCNNHSNLRKYIPDTQIVTLETLAVGFKEKPDKNYLLKPRDWSEGQGVMQIPRGLSITTLRHYLATSSFLPKEKPWANNKPFVIQEYLTNNEDESKLVIRVYAAVTVSAASDNTSRLTIHIASKAASGHVRIKQDPNDFTINNNKHNRCDISDVVNKIENFLNDFFNTALNKQKKINYKEWEFLAKKYIRNHNEMKPAERKLLLSQFIMALLQEQRFTRNKLSCYECFILDKFLQCYKAQDFELYQNNKEFLEYFHNSIVMLTRMNLIPFVNTDNEYYLNKVISSYCDILTQVPTIKSYCDSLKKDTKDVTPVEPSESDILNRVFGYLNKEDLESLCNTSPNLRQLVAGYVSAFSPSRP